MEMDFLSFEKEKEGYMLEKICIFAALKWK